MGHAVIAVDMAKKAGKSGGGCKSGYQTHLLQTVKSAPVVLVCAPSNTVDWAHAYEGRYSTFFPLSYQRYMFQGRPL